MGQSSKPIYILLNHTLCHPTTDHDDDLAIKKENLITKILFERESKHFLVETKVKTKILSFYYINKWV